MLLRIGLVMTMALGVSFAHAQDLEDNNGPASSSAPAGQHDDFNNDVDKAAQAPADKPHAAASESPKGHPVAGASAKKSKKAKSAAAKKSKPRDPSSVAKKKSKKHASKKKKKHS